MRWKLKRSDAHESQIELYKVEDSTYYFRVDGKEVVLRHPKNFPFSILTDEIQMSIEAWSPRQWRASHGSDVWIVQPQSFGQASQQAQTQIRSQMPGRIVDICMTEGQDIKAGDKLLVMEAMKMENEIRSDNDCVIKKIHVQKGQSVESDQILIEFDLA